MAEKDKGEAKPASVAGIPRWLAITGAVITAAGILSGAYFTKRNYDLNALNARNAQRAYVVIRSPSGRVHKGIIPMPGEEGDSTHKIQLSYAFDIRNIGKTPATILEYDLDIDGDPSWKRIGESFDLEKEEATQIEQDGVFPVKGLAIFNMDQAALDRYEERKKNSKYSLFYVKGELVYRDVFGQEHETRWCWTIGEMSSEFIPCKHTP